MKINKKAFALTDWDGGIRNVSVSIFDTRKEAEVEWKRLRMLPDPDEKGENKIIKVRIVEDK